jgi:hypothetical protein
MLIIHLCISMGEIIDKVKEKAKDAKDAVVDTTKDVAGKTKDTLDQSENTSVNSTDKEYEEGVAGTNKNRQSDPLTEFSDKEPMTPAKLNTGEPTAVKRDPSDQKITSEGQTGTNTPEAQEEYRKRGMTKVDTETSEENQNSSQTY